MKPVSKAQKLLHLSLVCSLAGCASPHVVEKYQIGDLKLSCPQLEEQMHTAEEFQAAAREEGGITGKNVAALALFWPALISTKLNVGEAVRAANHRKEHLYGIYVQKSCEGYVGQDRATPQTSPVNSTKKTITASRLAELDQMRAQGVVTNEDYIAIKRKLLGL